MTCELISRASIDSFRHAAADTGLKQLKLASRRLQQSLTVLAAERQLLQRLYYKNKNQHRGALFWRNVGELLRYLRKLDESNFQDLVAKLRNTFYGSTDGSSSMKGSWTHCPTQSYLTICSNRFEFAVRLLVKLSAVCVRAYKSFHRSMQSAAFLQILLMFIAVSSRLRCLALDLQKAMEDIHSSTKKLLDSLFVHPLPGRLAKAEPKSTAENSNITEIEIDDFAPIKLSSYMTQDIMSSFNKSQECVPQNTVHDITTTPGSVVVVETKMLKKVVKETSKKVINDTPKSSKSSKDLPGPKKKKRKIASKDEIDDIFGF